MTTREISLHKKQFEVLSFQRQFCAAIAGVRGGKTFLGSVWAAKKIQDFPKANGLIAAPSYKHLQQATLDTFFKIFPEYRKYYKQQQSVIDLPSGAKIFIRSTDDALGLEGMELAWAWLDEAGLMSKLTWTVVRSRVAIIKGQVLITTTPYSMNWLYQDVYLPWKNRLYDDIECFTWRSVDNPYFPKDYAESEKKRLSAEEFARRYEGEFTRMEGLVWDYPRELVTDMGLPAVQQLLKYPDRTIGGIDWGFHHSAAIVVARVKDARYYVVDEWKAEGKTTSEIAAVALEFKKRYNVDVWYPDSARPDLIEEFKRMGIRCGDTNKDVLIGLSHVGSLMREEKLLIGKNCTELLDEMSQYHYDEGIDGKPLKEAPVKINDDLCDAMRYMCMGHRPPDPSVIRARELARHNIKVPVFD